nr:TPA_asm: M95 uORF [Murid betaherpesvirus 1]DBA07856.1 TPA_asm: M95 uORF [Murid betaherpesvirus 1]
MPTSGNSVVITVVGLCRLFAISS